jgi:hypothetical protein
LRDRGLVRARWTIEQVFRVMKSQGFDVEQSQIETPEAMAKLSLAVFIAVLSANRISRAQRAWLQYGGYNAAYTDFSIPPST